MTTVDETKDKNSGDGVGKKEPLSNVGWYVN
jgi:hypothetical protein